MITILADPLRVCLDCGLEAYIEEDLDLFAKGKTSKYGKIKLCKKCRNERQRKYYEAHPEKIKERAQKYREENPEKIKERGRKYREANPEKIKEQQRKYREANRDMIRTKARKYYTDNRDKLNERQKKQYKANIIKEREYNRNHHATHPFRYAVKHAKKRSKKNGLAFDLTPEYLKQLWDECGGICPMTGVKMLKKSKLSDPIAKSLDRIDPEKGYTKDNVRLVSFWYNRTRNKWGDAFTLEMCQRVAERAYSPKMIEMLEAEGGKVK